MVLKHSLVAITNSKGLQTVLDIQYCFCLQLKGDWWIAELGQYLWKKKERSPSLLRPCCRLLCWVPWLRIPCGGLDRFRPMVPQAAKPYPALVLTPCLPCPTCVWSNLLQARIVLPLILKLHCPAPHHPALTFPSHGASQEPIVRCSCPLTSGS